MKKIKLIKINKYLLLLTLIVNISFLHAESNSSNNIKGAPYTGQTVAAGEWKTGANWNKGTAPDPSSSQCDLIFFDNITYNPTGTAPWTNPFYWTKTTNLIIEAGVIVTINSDLDINNNFSITIKTGGQFIVNGNVSINNNVTGDILGEMYITGNLTIAGGGSSGFTGTGSIIVDGTITDNKDVLDPNLITGVHRWLIVNNGAWAQNTSWSNIAGGTAAVSAPNTQCIVHIENGYTGVLNATAIIQDLDVQLGGTLNINPNTSLTVKGNVTSTGDIFIKSDASGTGGFIYNGATPVTATCERFVAAGQFHYISSPMTAAPVSSYNVTSGGYLNPNFYYYDETEVNADWMYAWRQKTSGNLTPGVGYALYTDENYAYSLKGGTLINQDFNVAITNTVTAGGSKSWNLIGNPFPCNIDADVFIDANDDASVFTGALYFWDDDGTDGIGYSSADYLVYTKGGGTTGGNGGISNGIIAPMQAFFVQAIDASGNLNFSTASKTASSGTFLKSISPIKETPIKMIRFTLSNTVGLFNDILIKFADDAEEGIDIYDGKKLKGNQNIAFYSILGNEHYAIQGFSNETEELSISLGIDATINSEYTIKAEDFVNIDKTTNIILEDKELNKYIDLRNEDYTFSFIGTDTERFVLHFEMKNENIATDIVEKNLDINTIYTSNNVIHINHIEFESIANIYDVTGKLIKTETINRGSNSIELNANPGYYIVKLITGNNVKSQKIIIQ